MEDICDKGNILDVLNAEENKELTNVEKMPRGRKNFKQKTCLRSLTRGLSRL